MPRRWARPPIEMKGVIYMKKIIQLLLEAMTYGYYPELNNVSHML